MSKKLFGKFFIFLLVVGLLFAATKTVQAQGPTVVTDAAGLTAALGDSTVTQIQLGANIDAGSVSGHAFSILPGRTVTLDLNGYEISAETSTGGVFYNRGTLTISDNSATQGGKIINTNTTQSTVDNVAKSAISNNGVLIVNAGVIVAGPATGHGTYPGSPENPFNPAYGIDNLGGGDVTVNSAIISGAYGLRNFANVDGTTITVNGGTITGKTGIAMQSFGTNVGTLTINGEPTVTATTGSAIYASGVTEYNQIVINGGTFSGPSAYGAVVVVRGTLDINGGTFTGIDGTYSLLNYHATVNVTEGAFYGDIYGGDPDGLTTFAPSEGAQIYVYGEISGSVAGVDQVDQEAAVHNVTQDTWHSTIQSAIDAATNGDTIEVAAGTYVEDVVVTNKFFNLIGEVDANGDPISILQGSLSIDNPNLMTEFTNIKNIYFEATDKNLLTLKNLNGGLIENCVFDGNNSFLTQPINGIYLLSSPNGQEFTVKDSLFKDGLYVSI